MFDQLKPLCRLQGAVECESVDLKAAADRWPVELQSDLLLILFGPRYARTGSAFESHPWWLGLKLLFMVELLFFPQISAIDCLMLVPLDG